MTRLMLVGKINDAGFQRAKKAAEFLAGQELEGVPPHGVEVVGLLPTDYEARVPLTLRHFAGRSLKVYHKGNVLALTAAVGGPGEAAEEEALSYLGGAPEFIAYVNDLVYYDDSRTHQVIYDRLAKIALRKYMEASRHSFVYLTFAVEGYVVGKVVLELFDDVCPQTCQNFKKLVMGVGGKGYKGTLLHRVVQDGWVQGGDVEEGTGTSGSDTVLPDETFAVKHDKPGMLGMSGNGRHTASSQFYITLRPLEWLDGKKVAFGRVIDGMRALRYISRRCELENERPVKDCIIEDCGTFSV